jgi:hypothetical protein
MVEWRESRRYDIEREWDAPPVTWEGEVVCVGFGGVGVGRVVAH